MTTSGDDQAGAGLQSRLRRELAAALRARDQVAVAALRTALSALANAEAVPAPAIPRGSVPAAGAASRNAAPGSPAPGSPAPGSPAPGSAAPGSPVPGSAAAGSAAPGGDPHIAGAAAGLGAAEAARRHIGEAEADRIVRAEISERLAAAEQYARAGHADRAGRLRREAAVLAAAVGEPA
ncbi:MAG TPA: hypothetical protein VGG35_09065 [Streptosporangiaceae bacterium]